MTDPRSFTTTDAGVPVESDDHTLTVGARGPILLQDFWTLSPEPAHRVTGMQDKA